MTIDQQPVHALQSGSSESGFESAAYARYSVDKQRKSSIEDQYANAERTQGVLNASFQTLTFSPIRTFAVPLRTGPNSTVSWNSCDLAAQRSRIFL
jgi:hypothetical protein